MPKDKFTAIWVSHSSISDFLECPRAYYLKNVYKDPKTNRKIQLMSPPLALGQIVHEVLESLSVLNKDSRFNTPLPVLFEKAWQKVSGKKGGFWDNHSEMKYKNRGLEMLRRVYNNPGPIKELAVKIKEDLPYYWISEEDNIILCGKIDWLEYFSKSDSVHIIDFKTGKNEENNNSMQLPIYYLIASNCQSHKVSKASYWYLDRDNQPQEVSLPNLDIANLRIMEIAKKIKLARQLNKFNCPHNGCRTCSPLEKILNGKAEHVGIDHYNRDIYVLKEIDNSKEESSVVL